ncbi:MAG: HAD family hydrolase [Solirubrobacteraceae bacterium]
MGRLSWRRRSHGPRPLPADVGAVLLDAFGTLVHLDAPAPLLRALLLERLGVEVTEAHAGEALRAEIGYYRAHMHEGVDLLRVARLHAACAEVLRRALPPDPRVEAASPRLMTEIMLESLRFSVYDEVPEVLARLRAAGLRLVVASNWDASLDTVLDRVGLLEVLDGVVNSAAAGYAKPDPRLLETALRLAGVAPNRALHVGDGFREDVGAALGAGVRPLLLARDRAAGAVEYGPAEPTIPELLVIATLAELPALLGV